MFTTSKGLDFIYTIRGGEMYVDRKEKSITRATVKRANKRVVELKGAEKGPRRDRSSLCPSVSYFCKDGDYQECWRVMAQLLLLTERLFCYLFKTFTNVKLFDII